MIFQADNATICALSTAPGMGAIAVIRVSGPDAIGIGDAMFSRDLRTTDSHKALFGIIRKGEQIIDEVLLTVFKGPHSFTGEDVIEIGCHGSVFIQNQILQLLVADGCRYAKPGEFTFRAFFNRKMDLSQAEAVADLIAAESAGAHELALNQMRGGFSHEIAHLREQLINFASLIELELDFAEEDVEFADRSQLTKLLFEIEVVLKRLIDSFQSGNAIKNGIPVAIVGKPNAGKSTLLNVFLNEERAIVSEIPGTTRDTVEDRISIEGVSFRFIDTAGLRETEDLVEKIGVERSMEAIKKATIVLYVYDVSELTGDTLSVIEAQLRADLDSSRQSLLMVGNKIDTSSPDRRHPDHLYISAKNKTDIHGLHESLINLSNIRINTEGSTVTNIRHYEALTQAYKSLQEVLTGMENAITGDFLAIDIRKALHHLGEITGEITSDDLLGNIFGKFCIGK
jgi:tRNA modification GTPase